jgi:hypothetical protein
MKDSASSQSNKLRTESLYWVIFDNGKWPRVSFVVVRDNWEIASRRNSNSSCGLGFVGKEFVPSMDAVIFSVERFNDSSPLLLGESNGEEVGVISKSVICCAVEELKDESFCSDSIREAESKLVIRMGILFVSNLLTKNLVATQHSSDDNL